MKTLLVFFMSFFNFKNIEDIPKVEGKAKLSESDKTALIEALGEEKFTTFMKGVNKELELAAKKNEAATFKTEVLKALEEHDPDLTAKQKEEILAGNNGDLDVSASIKQLTSTLKDMQAKNAKLEQQVHKLANLDEVAPPAIEATNKIIPMKHSATHLFSSNQSWDAFEKRPWNEAFKELAAGNIIKAKSLMSFNSYKNLQPVVEQLGNDLDDYYTQNPGALVRLNYDNFGLPSFWPKRTGVIHSIRDAGIRTNELTQARAAGWAAKNDQHIEVEERQVFPIKVDAEIQGIRLQQLAETWMQQYMNPASGSYAQTSFVMFLVENFNAQREQEDNQHTIDGVYVNVPDKTNGTGSGNIAVNPGKAVHRQHGLMFYLWYFRNITKQIKPFESLGTPTADNIKAYLPKYIKSLPANLQNATGLVTYMNWDLFVEYNKATSETETMKELLQNIVNLTLDDVKKLDYTKFIGHVKGYPNQKICPLPQIGNSTVMFTTFEDNIEVLENDPKEKEMWQFDKLRRDLYFYTDYKMGTGFVRVGKKNVADTDKKKYLTQSVWSNQEPVYSTDFTVPVYDFKDGVMKLNYNKVYVDENWKTEVTSLELALGGKDPVQFPAGQLVFITGNPALASVVKIKKIAGKLDLASDFDMKTAGTLTLVSTGDGNFKELSRTTEAPTVSNAEESFSLDAIDAAQASTFNFVGSTAVTLATISNGVENQIITIKGSADAVLTIATAGNVNVGADVTLANENASVSLIFAAGTWYKYS